MSGDVVVTVGGIKSDPLSFEVDYFAHLKAMNRMSIDFEDAKLVYEEDLSGQKRPAGAAALRSSLQLDSSNITWKGSSFVAKYTEQRSDGWILNHTVSGAFDESGERLLEATVSTEGQEAGQKSPSFTRNTSFKVSNLPLSPTLSPRNLRYELKGPATSGSVSGISDEYVQSDGTYSKSFRSVDWNSAQPRVSFTMMISN
jgi:hypothetical protein